MRGKNMALATVFLSALICCLAGCSEIMSEDFAGQSYMINMAEESELFKEVPNESNKYIFKTNDTKYIRPRGCTVWRKVEDGMSENEISYDLMKVSGASNYGYGILFNIHIDDEGRENMICVMISIVGKYCIGKVTDGIYSEILPWTDSASLKSGFSNTNTITVKYLYETRQFALSINGNESEVFSNPVSFSYDSSLSGIFAVISPFEAFPNTNVEVHYTRRSI